MKKGKLSRIEIHYIQTNPSNLSVKDLAAELNRSEEAVLRFMPKVSVETKKEVETEEPKQFIQLKEHMGIHERGAAVMTPNASEILDAARKENKRAKKNLPDCVFQPYKK